MKRKQVKNYDADAPTRESSVASAHGATGLMFDPPRTDSEAGSLEAIQSLETVQSLGAIQSLEAPAPPFGYSDKPLPHDEQCIYPRIKRSKKEKL